MSDQTAFSEPGKLLDALYPADMALDSAAESKSSGTPYINISRPEFTGQISSSYGPSKRVLDIVGSATLLMILAPLFILMMLLLASSKGGMFFPHMRIGRNGKPFHCLKFRTMVPDAQLRLAALLRDDPAAAREWEQHRKLRHDPRVTRLGRFLRASSLDELPQLLNVLRGDMSLVGPRPVTPFELQRYYGDDAQAYLSVRPGITGLWQVSGRSTTGYNERVRLDAAYVRDSSLRVDLRILLATPAAVLTRRGAV